jgi:Fe2+ transport system protein FeoA
MKLSDCKEGLAVIISEINCIKNIKEKLSFLGVVKNTKIMVVRRASFSGPIEIKVRDFYLAIRKKQADKIEVYYE